jgi:hypothetical protein
MGEPPQYVGLQELFFSPNFEKVQVHVLASSEIDVVLIFSTSVQKTNFILIPRETTTNIWQNVS